MIMMIMMIAIMHYDTNGDNNKNDVDRNNDGGNVHDYDSVFDDNK